MSEICFAYITAENPEEAKRLGTSLLENKLAACINIIGSMESLYWWKGKIESGKESILIAKTTESQFPKLSEHIEKIHSYDCPCILKLPIAKANSAYHQWLMDSLK